MYLAVGSTILSLVCGRTAIMTMAKWKPLKLCSLDDTVNRKQYEIQEEIAEITARTKDLNTVGQWSASLLCLIRQSVRFGIWHVLENDYR